MKNTKKPIGVWAVLLLCLQCFFPFASMAQQSPVPLVAISNKPDHIQIRFAMSPLPRENPADLSLQGGSWDTSAKNWTDSLLAGLQSLGTGYNRAYRIGWLDPSWMVTSTNFQSWHARPHGDIAINQFGNRIHVAVHIEAIDSSVTFMSKDIVISARGYGYTGSTWITENLINRSTTMEILNYFRMCLDQGGAPGPVGDTKSSVQNSSAAIRAFLYGGLGLNVAAGGEGNQEQQLLNAVHYLEDNNIVILYTVTIPYKYRVPPTENNPSGEMTGVATGQVVLLPLPLIEPDYPESTYRNPGAFEFGYAPDSVMPSRFLNFGETFPGNGSSFGTLYLLQRSKDLQFWNSMNMVALFGNGDMLTFPTGTPDVHDDPRMFYRVVVIKPGSLTAPLFAQAGMAPQQGAELDVLAQNAVPAVPQVKAKSRNSKVPFRPSGVFSDVVAP